MVVGVKGTRNATFFFFLNMTLFVPVPNYNADQLKGSILILVDMKTI